MVRVQKPLALCLAVLRSCVNFSSETLVFTSFAASCWTLSPTNRVGFCKCSLCDRQPFAKNVCKDGPLLGRQRKSARKCLLIMEHRFSLVRISGKLSQDPGKNRLISRFQMDVSLHGGLVGRATGNRTQTRNFGTGKSRHVRELHPFLQQQRTVGEHR